MAVTCEVDAPSAMAFWKRVRSNCHLAGLAGRRDHRNDAQLLPELSDGAQNRGLRHFAAQRVLQLRDGGVARLQQLVGLDGQLRNLARTGQLRAATPVAVAAQGIHVGQNPGWPQQSRAVRRAGPADSAERLRRRSPDAPAALRPSAICLAIGGRVALAGDGLNKRRRDGGEELPPRQEETQSRLLNPGPGILQCECPMSVLAHPFGARCFQLFCCQRKTSLPGWRFGINQEILCPGLA